MQNLLTYVKTRCKEGDFGLFVNISGEATSYVIAIEILDWLKEQKRFRHNNGLELNPMYTWCQQLHKLLTIDCSLSRLFEIVDNQLRFKSSISTEERESLRELAELEYKPEIRT